MSAKSAKNAAADDDRISDLKLEHWGFNEDSCFKCGIHNSQISNLLMQCALCKRAYYCSMKCFNEDLESHQKMCRTAQLTVEPERREHTMPEFPKKTEVTEKSKEKWTYNEDKAKKSAAPPAVKAVEPQPVEVPIPPPVVEPTPPPVEEPAPPIVEEPTPPPPPAPTPIEVPTPPPVEEPTPPVEILPEKDTADSDADKKKEKASKVSSRVPNIHVQPVDLKGLSLDYSTLITEKYWVVPTMVDGVMVNRRVKGNASGPFCDYITGEMLCDTTEHSIHPTFTAKK